MKQINYVFCYKYYSSQREVQLERRIIKFNSEKCPCIQLKVQSLQKYNLQQHVKLATSLQKESLLACDDHYIRKIKVNNIKINISDIIT